jgi:hypothetical protein
MLDNELYVELHAAAYPGYANLACVVLFLECPQKSQTPPS